MKCLSAALLLATLAPAQDAVDFGRDVRPILSNLCFACHGPDGAQRKAGLRLDTRAGATALLETGHHAVVPGNPEKSAVLSQVRHPDPNKAMPPRSTKKDITEAQIAVLEQWIAEGASYSTHWSFVPPVRSPLPPVQRREWPHNPIDHFVLASLEAEGMTPSTAATPQRLLRRVHLDLTGLPPTPEDLGAFLEDQSQDSYARTLAALFASPRHGEHLTRYWLDAARYGDTHGLHLDNYRSIWPYRDWVIDAFQQNLPFDQFTVDQLAGDLLPEPTREQLVATGFNRCNVSTAEGGMIAEEYLAKYTFDRIETLASVWMGLTMTCCRCHDHKFDPITQREYYGLFAFMNSFDEEASDKNAALPAPSLAVPTPQQEQELERRDREIGERETALDAPMPEVDRAQSAWEQEMTPRAQAWQVLVPRSALSTGGSRFEFLDDRSLLVTGTNPQTDEYEIVAISELAGMVALRVELLTSDTHGGGIGRASHRNIVLTRVEVEAAPVNQPHQVRTVELSAAGADFSQPQYPITAVLDKERGEGWALAKAVKENHSAVFTFSEPLPAMAGGTLLRVRLVFDSNHREHNPGRVRLAVTASGDVAPTALGPWQMAGPYPHEAAKEIHGRLFPPEQEGTDVEWRQRPDLVDGKAHVLKDPVVGAYYFRRTVATPIARPYTATFGSDDALKVWLDGELVFDRNVARGVKVDQDKVTLHLPAGEHLLMAKVSNTGGAAGFAFRPVGEHPLGLAAHALALLAMDAGSRSPDDDAILRRAFRRDHSPEWRTMADALAAFEKERDAFAAAFPQTMITRERTEPRVAHILRRGQYDQKGEPVARAVPATLPPLPDGAPDNRLGLARWLVSGVHPLTARVTMNRLWQMVFGRGLVATPEDFGTRGAWPSHPELLDWLAVEFVESGWDLRHMLRLMVDSATYQQSSVPTAEGLERDRDNLLLGRGPRHRLDAEVIRDSSLFVSGLLHEQVGGKSVKPYQPPNLWKPVAYPSSTTAVFKRDEGQALYRRSLYTFWKRTAPPPSMVLFDTPTREACAVGRAATNTPLQALVLLNDEQFVEAARALAERELALPGDDGTRLARAFVRCTGRQPGEREIAVLAALLQYGRDRFARDQEGARALVATGASALDETIPVDELAAWTLVANTLLNLDETITKR